MFFSNTKSDKNSKNEKTINESEYINDLEKRVEAIVSSIDGAGKSEVMINIASTSETVYVKENKNSYDSSEEVNKGESENSVLTMTDSTGNQYAVVTKTIMPQISGVIVACDGGNIQSVKATITDAVCTVLGIGANNVCVIAKS